MRKLLLVTLLLLALLPLRPAAAQTAYLSYSLPSCNAPNQVVSFYIYVPGRPNALVPLTVTSLSKLVTDRQHTGYYLQRGLTAQLNGWGSAQNLQLSIKDFPGPYLIT